MKKSQQILKKIKKKSNWSYQKKQLTLKNLDRAQSQPSTLPSTTQLSPKISSPIPSATVNQLLIIRPKQQQKSSINKQQQSPITQQQLSPIKKQQSPIYVSPTSPIRKKWYCDLCNKQLASYQTYYQHKTTKTHIANM